MKRLSGLLIAWAGWILAARAADPTLATVGTFGLAPRGVETLAYHRPANLLLATDALRGELHLLQPTSWDPPALSTVDAFPSTDSSEAVPSPGQPTSVAAHPSAPLALVVVASRLPLVKGEVMFVDLRDRSAGRVLRSQPVGFHPDHVAITPDGRWALVANEGESDRRTEGSIGLLDLRILTGWEENRLQAVPYRELGGLEALLGEKAGRLEPEYVAVDPRGRCAAVSLQENDAVVLVDLRGEEPALASVLRLPRGSEPDGLALLDGPLGDLGRTSALLAIAEEGRKAQSVSFYAVDTDRPEAEPLFLSRRDVRPLINAERPRKERNPEAVLLRRAGDRVFALVAIERGNRILCLEVTDPRAPRFVARVPVGARPESLLFLEQPGGGLLLSANEGDEETPASISVMRWQDPR
jgi:hypothetical protein